MFVWVSDVIRWSLCAAALIVDVIFKLISRVDYFIIFCGIALSCIPRDSMVISFDNGLVPPGNMTLPEPMLIQMYATIWRHWAIVL